MSAVVPMPSFSQLSPQERRLALAGQGHPSEVAGWPCLDEGAANCMVENVVGLFALPQAVAVHLCVDGVARKVPMVTEEASIVAALSSAGKLTARAGGIVTTCDESLLVCQVQLSGLSAAAEAARSLLTERAAWLARANAACPRLVARGGGVRGFEAMVLEPSGQGAALLVHLLVDTCDAMGANIVNRLGEALAPALVAATGSQRAVSILSNLSERSLVTARASVPLQLLARGQYAGEDVRDGIVRVSNFAWQSTHRAVTHNKGIMNGIDAVAVATGNDWRAIEANAHAYAGRLAGYRPLSKWWAGPAGELVGELTVPLKVGTKGGNFGANPGVQANLALLGCTSAKALARVMAAVGLAQNLAALRALGTEGIQAGHMALHARSVLASAGIPAAEGAEVVAAMLAGGDVSVARAQALWSARAGAGGVPAHLAGQPAACTEHPAQQGAVGGGASAVGREAGAEAIGDPVVGEGAGKLLLFGEHAVVYGAHAVALPLGLACRATLTRRRSGGVQLSIPAWHIEARLADEPSVGGVHHSLHVLLAKLGLLRQSMHIDIVPGFPRGVGLGSSAALAVAVVRALSQAYGLHLGDQAVEALAFEAEKVAHATPSGVDNALATYGRPILFRRDNKALLQPLHVARPFVLVIGMSHEHTATATMVRRVRAAREAQPAFCDDLFARIDDLALAGQRALAAGDLALLGKLMNLNHGLLHTLDLSTPGVEDIVFRARAAGALGAKLTGGGGGGAVLALCADDGSRVAAALSASRYRTLIAHVPASLAHSASKGALGVG